MRGTQIPPGLFKGTVKWILQTSVHFPDIKASKADRDWKQKCANTETFFSDNPLNCDCLMAGFARWLREAENLSQTDKSAAVCATPPHLEGALLSRLSKNKLCDDFEHIELKNNRDANYDLNKILANAIDVNEKMAVDTTDDYVDKGLDDDLYDDEMEVPSEDDLPISKAKVILKRSLCISLKLCHFIS